MPSDLTLRRLARWQPQHLSAKPVFATMDGWRRHLASCALDQAKARRFAENALQMAAVAAAPKYANRPMTAG